MVSLCGCGSGAQSPSYKRLRPGWRIERQRPQHIDGQPYFTRLEGFPADPAILLLPLEACPADLPDAIDLTTAELPVDGLNPVVGAFNFIPVSIAIRRCDG
jgi:hypothetical protein